MRILRSCVAGLVLLGVVALAPNVASAPPAQACSVQTGSTYQYDTTSFRFIFAIHLCDDRTSISYGADGLHELVGGGGNGTAIDGVAPCTNRVCVVQFGFVHGPERARYNGDVFWADVAYDALGPIRCVSTSARAACRP